MEKNNYLNLLKNKNSSNQLDELINKLKMLEIDDLSINKILKKLKNEPQALENQNFIQNNDLFKFVLLQIFNFGLISSIDSNNNYNKKHKIKGNCSLNFKKMNTDKESINQCAQTTQKVLLKVTEVRPEILTTDILTKMMDQNQSYLKYFMEQKEVAVANALVDEEVRDEAGGKITTRRKNKNDAVTAPTDGVTKKKPTKKQALLTQQQNEQQMSEELIQKEREQLINEQQQGLRIISQQQSLPDSQQIQTLPNTSEKQLSLVGKENLLLQQQHQQQQQFAMTGGLGTSNVYPQQYNTYPQYEY